MLLPRPAPIVGAAPWDDEESEALELAARLVSLARMLRPVRGARDARAA